MCLCGNLGILKDSGQYSTLAPNDLFSKTKLSLTGIPYECKTLTGIFVFQFYWIKIKISCKYC